MTLAFSWATNTNYSAGPDLGTATKVDPASTANGFVSGVIAAPQHINFLFDAVGDQIVKAVDGVGGGTYTLGSALRFQGADVEINAGLEILAAGELNVQSGGLINVLDGGILTVAENGILMVDANGDLQVDGNFLLGGAGVIDSAAALRSNATECLTINGPTDAFRCTLGSAVVQHSGGAPTWTPETRGRGWRQADVAGGFEVAFPITLPVGEDIVSITVAVNGGVGAGHASLPAGTDRLRVLLVRTDTAGVATVLAERYDQSASVGVYDADHAVVLASGSLDGGSLPITTNDLHTYWICIEGEHGANAVANTTVVQAVVGVNVARLYRSEMLLM